MASILVKSVLHNLGVAAVGFIFALLGRGIDFLLRVTEFHSVTTTVVGSALVATGFLIRIWATYFFYRHHMKVISLEPQQRLITGGPYRFSRNPLYVGGNLFIFLGAVLILGSKSGLVLTAINLVVVDLMIRREEEQLKQRFGGEWMRYSRQVRRWF